MPFSFDVDACRVLYDEGWFDYEIGGLLGVSASLIRYWRRRAELPANGGYAPLPPPVSVLQGVDATDSDREVAELLGVSRSGVQGWRKRRHVPSKAKANRTIRPWKSEMQLKRWAAYCLSTSSKQAAERAGVSESSMVRWIRSQKLPPYAASRRMRAHVLAAAKKGDKVAKDAAIHRGWWRRE